MRERENGSTSASPQQVGLCEHFADPEEESYPKWEEPRLAQQGVSTVALPTLLHGETMLPCVGSGARGWWDTQTRRLLLICTCGLNARRESPV